MHEKVVVYPGRFDPPTLGHLDIIARSIDLFGHLVITVAEDFGKSSLWSTEQRLEVLSEACQGYQNISVLPFSGLLVDWMSEQGFHTIVRGIRDSVDMSVEWRMAHSNRVLNHKIETVFLASSPSVSHISSTLVRQVIASGGDVGHFVPKAVLTRF